MNQPPEQPENLPRGLAERLARDDRVTLLTPLVDEAVRRAAAAHFATRGVAPTTHAERATGTRRVTRRWAFPAAAAAAAALFAILVVRPFDNVGTGVILTNDVDGSGRVDILDAFALARARAADPSRVTQAQVDGLASQIVSLTSGPNGR